MSQSTLAFSRYSFLRPRRAHEWSEQKAVTFIVTLAARGNVTLAARIAGMSRKAAYALRARDDDFAKAWDSALEARRQRKIEGDKSDEGDDPPFAPPKGDSLTVRASDARHRDLFAGLANRGGIRRAASAS